MNGISMKLDSASVEKALKKYKSNFESDTPMQAAVLMAWKGVMDNFNKQSDPTGARWASIKRIGKILQDKGKLKSSIGFDVKNKEGVLFTSLVYASTHQFGDKKRNIKKRSFLGLTKRWIENVAKAFLYEVMKIK